MTPGPRFGVALACIDGRITGLVSGRLRQDWGVDHVDLVTTPGPETALARSADDHLWNAVQVSLDRHGARQAAVVAHTGCAANVVTDVVRLQQLGEAVTAARTRLPGVTVSGWLVHTDTQRMEEVA
jgi:hypothetical protein